MTVGPELRGERVLLVPVTAGHADGAGWHDGLLMDLLAEELHQPR